MGFEVKHFEKEAMLFLVPNFYNIDS